MARKLSDDEIMDYTYNKLFGDLDKIRSGSMFSSDSDAIHGAAPNAGTPGGLEGISLTIKPLMAGASESGRPPESGEEEEEEEEEMKGPGKK